MKISTRLTILKNMIVGLIAIGSASQLTAHSKDLNDSIVEIRVYAQKTDFDSPWRKSSISSLQYNGIVLSKKYILTSASAIAYSTLIEVNKVGDAEIIPCVVALIDHNANLALIMPKNAEKFENVTPIRIGPPIAIGSSATLATGRNSQRLFLSPVRLYDVDLMDSETSSYRYTQYLFETTKPGDLGWSEPIIDESDQLIGLTVNQQKNILQVIPAKIINHFWNDFRSGEYRGFVYFGFETRLLNTPHLRNFIKADASNLGIMVAKVYKSSPFIEELKPFDVITKIGSVPIYSNGLYDNPIWEKVSFTDLLTNYHSGDEVKLTVMRAGEKLVIKANARTFNQNEFLVPGFTFSTPAHLIFAGFLFQELNLGFLKTWGTDWEGRAPDPMVRIFIDRNEATNDEQKRVIILNRVLPDSHNRGYEHFRNLVVETVNGQKIDSLAKLKEAFSKPLNPKDPFATIQFGYGGGQVILDYKNLAESHQRIAKSFNIQSQNSFYAP